MTNEKGNVRLMKAKDELPPGLRRTFETNVDLPADTRVAMIELLNQELADTADIYSQTKQAHWNVKGIHFYQLHLLFDQLAEKRQEEADELAERATELGGTSEERSAWPLRACVYRRFQPTSTRGSII